MRIFTCNTCTKIHIEIGNTQLHFASLNLLGKYLEFLDSIDTDYYVAVNRKKGLKKVIVISIAENGAAHLGFTEQEFETLKESIRTYINKKQKTKRPEFSISLNDMPLMRFN